MRRLQGFNLIESCTGFERCQRVITGFLQIQVRIQINHGSRRIVTRPPDRQGRGMLLKQVDVALPNQLLCLILFICQRIFEGLFCRKLTYGKSPRIDRHTQPGQALQG